eukprot:gene19526-26202_t
MVTSLVNACTRLGTPNQSLHNSKSKFVICLSNCAAAFPPHRYSLCAYPSGRVIQSRCVQVRAGDDNEAFKGPSKEAYSQAMSMAQLYSATSNRPDAIPLEELVAGRKKKDAQEICDSARRKGKSEAYVRERLAALEAFIPDAINLHKLKASDYVTLIDDVPGVANKLVVLKTLYPKADVFKIIGRLPRLMLRSDARIQADAVK